MKIELDRLSDIERKEYEVFGYCHFLVKRFRELSGMTLEKIGLEIEPEDPKSEKRTKDNAKQYAFYHQQQGNSIRYTPSDDRIQMVTRQRLI